MELYVTLLVTLALVYALYRVLRRGAPGGMQEGRQTPPSLPWVPLLGSLPFLSPLGKLHTFFMDKARRYGNVFTFYAGHKEVLVLNGYKVIQEALAKHPADYAGRGEWFVEKNIWNPQLRGILFKQYSEVLKMNRLHSVAILKQFGFGDKRVMETKVLREVEEVLRAVRARQSAAFDPDELMAIATLNVVYDMLFSERLAPGDPTGKYLYTAGRMFAASLDPVYDVFPLVAHLPHFKRKLESLRPDSKRMYNFFSNKIVESLARTDTEDSFVREYVERAGERYDAEELTYILRDLVLAATETTSTQLAWMFVYIGNHPAVQKRMQAEIDAAVPRERLPSLDDKMALPYTEAALLEVMRLRTVVPLSMPRVTTCRTEVAGFSIPARREVVVNLWSAHMDEELWAQPEVFRPERFLDEKGEVTNRDLVLTFSLGKRACLGEVLARQELFLLMAGLLQHFTIAPPEGEARIKNEMVFIRTLAPAAFKVRFLPRAPLAGGTQGAAGPQGTGT